jgi:hypothetical protein
MKYLILASLDEIHVTALYGAISALTAGMAWVVKLFYVDVKQGEAKCEERSAKLEIHYEQRLQEERKECKEDLNEHKQVINEHKQVINALQSQVNTLTSHVLEMKGKESGIHH